MVLCKQGRLSVRLKELQEQVWRPQTVSRYIQGMSPRELPVLQWLLWTKTSPIITQKSIWLPRQRENRLPWFTVLTLLRTSMHGPTCVETCWGYAIQTLIRVNYSPFYLIKQCRQTQMLVG